MKISLISDEKVLRQMANKFMMGGDKDEGTNDEYYVTASYSVKIQGASQVNVDVANPDYKKGHPQNPSQPQPKPQPQKNTPKFPAGPQEGVPKQADPKGNILEAVFINDTGKELKKVSVGDKVRVRIHSKNMVGKHIQYVVWEYDAASNDEIYRSANIKIPADVCDTSVFVITKDVFRKGIDSSIGDPDTGKQNYFIEIISKDLSAESQKFGVDSNGLMEVENVKSTAMVKGQPKPEKPGEKVCECEARVRAFIRMVRVGEGTGELIKSYNKKHEEAVYVVNDFQKGYTTAFNNNKITDLSTNPQKNYGGSTAAGAYQIMGYTFKNYNGWYESVPESRVFDKYVKEKDYAKKYNIKSFDDESQDKYCVAMMKHHPGCSNFITEVIDNKIENVIRAYGSITWASLPEKGNFSRYLFKGKPQPVTPMQICIEHYDKFLKDELAGISNLHLKNGFLKEFGYGCCEESKNDEVLTTNNGKWRNPIDNPMLCLYSQGGGYKPWHGSFGEKIRDNSANHTGNDLLATPNTKVYACVQSIVHKIYTSGSMAGNVVVLKVLDTETFKSLKRKNYTPKYKSKGEILEKGFNENGTIYLTFWHLSKNNFFKEGDEVKYNDIIGLTGISGWNGQNFTTRNPNLHFEVSNVGSAPGLNGKCNPSIYFKFKTENELSKSEIDFQNKLKEKEWK